jgi:hypothetical protein
MGKGVFGLFNKKLSEKELLKKIQKGAKKAKKAGVKLVSVKVK